MFHLKKEMPVFLKLSVFKVVKFRIIVKFRVVSYMCFSSNVKTPVCDF